MVPAATVPSALALPNLSVPADTVVEPEKVLMADKDNAASPDLTRLPVPETTPETALPSVALAISNVLLERFVAPEIVTLPAVNFTCVSGVPANIFAEAEVVAKSSIDNDPPTPVPPFESKEPVTNTNL